MDRAVPDPVSERTMSPGWRGAPAAARARPPAWAGYALLAAAALAAAVGVDLVLEAGTLERPEAFAALTAWTVVGFVGAGVLWRALRPSNRLGAVLVAAGVCAAVHMLQGTDATAPFSLGVLFDLPLTLLAWYAILAFPSGRLDRAGRAVMTSAAAVLTATFVPWVLTSPEIQGGSPLSGCAARCPENALLVADGGRAADVLWDLLQAGRVVVSIAVAGLLIARLARASAPRRRALAPVAVVAVAWIVAFGAYGLGVNELGVDGHAELALVMCVVVARGLLPLAFLLAPVLARAFAGVALARMVGRLGRGATVARRERVIGEALDDPRLRLAFWLPGAGGYVDRDGRPIAPPPPGSGLAWTPIGAGEPPAAALVHDAALSEEPELLRAAGQTLLLALDNTRLEDELEEAAGELAQSRSRLVQAETTDRRRLERELHDRTQQQLVALRVRLGLAADRADDDPALARLLAQLGADLEVALSDVRGIAGALYPALLADEGLPAALAAAARHSGASPSRVGASGVGRYPQEVEAAVYFALEEAMAIAAAAPGGAAGLWTRLSDGDGALRFELGCEGGTPPGAAERLPGMSALVGAVGGELAAAEGPRGWVVSGTVPDP
jgi:signal transduction histidine kinase